MALTAPSQSVRSLHFVRKIKTSLWLEHFFRYTIRTAIIAAVLRIASRDVAQGNLSGRPPKWWIRGITLLHWLILSPGLFFPCAILIDLGVCGVFGWQMERTYLFSNWSAGPEDYTYRLRGPEDFINRLSRIMVWIAILFIALLRIMGLGLALAETYFSARSSSSTSLRQAYFDLIMRSNYDWWTLKSLPRDWLQKPWYRRLCRPWLSSCPKPSSTERPQHEIQEPVTPYLSILFGAWTFSSRRGERPWFIVFRGILAMTCLAILAAFSISVLALQPAREGESPPIQRHSAPSLPANLESSTFLWGVAIGMRTGAQNLNIDTLSALTSVMAAAPGTPEDLVPCNRTYNTTWRSHDILAYQCPNRTESGFHHILVRTDYAAMGISRSNFTLGRNLIVWPTFSTDIEKVLPHTKGTNLIIGHNALVSVEPVVWARLTTPALAALGFGSDEDLQVVGQVSMLGVDPFITGGDLTQSGGPASMRLLAEVPITNREIYWETRQHSVLAGFSALGGLSAFLNSFFIIFFGGSIMFVLFDAKPLSIFGLIHRFSNTGISQHLETDFPQLLKEGGQPGQPPSGFVAFIREYLMDLSGLQLQNADGDSGRDATGAPESDDTGQVEMSRRLPVIAHSSATEIDKEASSR